MMETMNKTILAEVVNVLNATDGFSEAELAYLQGATDVARLFSGDSSNFEIVTLEYLEEAEKLLKDYLAAKKCDRVLSSANIINSSLLAKIILNHADDGRLCQHNVEFDAAVSKNLAVTQFLFRVEWRELLAMLLDYRYVDMMSNEVDENGGLRDPDNHEPWPLTGWYTKDDLNKASFVEEVPLLTEDEYAALPETDAGRYYHTRYVEVELPFLSPKAKKHRILLAQSMHIKNLIVEMLCSLPAEQKKCVSERLLGEATRDGTLSVAAFAVGTAVNLASCMD